MRSSTPMSPNMGARASAGFVGFETAKRGLGGTEAPTERGLVLMIPDSRGNVSGTPKLRHPSNAHHPTSQIASGRLHGRSMFKTIAR
jgi:hypothetical protein